MKRKIRSIIIDLVLITGILTIVDILALKVFHSKSIWLDIGLYIVLYIIVFGVKREIVVLWERRKKNGSANEDE